VNDRPPKIGYATLNPRGYWPRPGSGWGRSRFHWLRDGRARASGCILEHWRDGFEFAWQAADPEPDEGPGLTWRQLTPRDWSGTWDSKIRGTVTRDGDGWVAYLRLEDPPGLSLITTVGRYTTVEEAQVATDETWAAR
jgi:hypothetical protein